MELTTTSEGELEKRTNPTPPDPLTLPPLDLNQRYDALFASAYLKQCLATTRKQIADGTLESFTDGRRRYVPGTAIAARSRADQPA